jgi:hypothetical protein
MILDTIYALPNNFKTMKIIKGFFNLLLAWIVCLFLLFGSSFINYLGVASDEITEPKELAKYNGYVVKTLKTDLFGNWVIAKKGREEVVFRCDESIFSNLTISDSLGE